MPFVNIRIYEGWGKDNLNEIAKRVTAAITDVTKLPKEAVWVVLSVSLGKKVLSRRLYPVLTSGAS